MPRVSIIMPCYNASATLAEAVQSIATQTFADWELVAVDDGSMDDTLERLHALADREPRLRVLPMAHGGIVEALQAGCAAAGGEVIARMDADDAARPERLGRQLELLESDARIGLCGTRVRMAGERVGPGRRRYEAWINGLVTQDDMARELFVECPVPHPTFMMRRDAFEAAGGYEDHGWAEDYDLVMRLYTAGWRFAKVPEPLLDWREHGERLSMRSNRYSEARFRALKRRYLFTTHLRDNRPFYQWGAGEVGKRWLREWNEPAPRAVADVNPRKVGGAIHGVTVIPPEDLPPPGEAMILVAVGAPGAREDIRAWLGPRGHRECVDFLFVA